MYVDRKTFEKDFLRQHCFLLQMLNKAFIKHIENLDQLFCFYIKNLC